MREEEEAGKKRKKFKKGKGNREEKNESVI